MSSNLTESTKLSSINKDMTYQFWGKVTHGKNRGKSHGFPTINLRLHKKIPEGVYVSITKYTNIWHKSLSFVGIAKTFEDTDIHAESYIFDFNHNLYGKWISIKILKKIRNNRKFSSKEELIKQIKEDQKQALQYFNRHTL